MEVCKQKTENKDKVSDLKWQDDKGNERTAETDSDKAHTLADFFSSVYTVEDNEDFEYLPMRITDNQMKMTDVILNCDMIEAKLAKLKTDKLHMLDLSLIHI